VEKAFTLPATQSDCFLLVRGRGGVLRWEKVKCDSTAEQIAPLLGKQEALVLYSETYAGYFSPLGVSDVDLTRSILTAPWEPRSGDGVRCIVYLQNAANGSYKQTVRMANRYDLAGRWGQLLRDVGDAACKSGITIALVDAFVWLRGGFVEPVCRWNLALVCCCWSWRRGASLSFGIIFEIPI
jgi:hypothetical protein